MKGLELRGRALVASALLLAPLPASAAEMDRIFTFFEVEQLEYRYDGDQNTINWDAQGWVGGDDDKIWFKSEGEQIQGGPMEEAEVQLLYSHRISDFFDIQGGLRYDFDPSPDRGFAVLGIEGLAQHFFEIDAAVFLSNQGEISARFKGEYDLLITQRLILQPRLETNIAVQDVEERGIGPGFNDIELGLRLRYEIVREFAPYVGVSWERSLGKTADYVRDEGEEVGGVSFVAGLRFWF